MTQIDLVLDSAPVPADVRVRRCKVESRAKPEPRPCTIYLVRHVHNTRLIDLYNYG